jgi:hypothetical protein
MAARTTRAAETIEQFVARVHAARHAQGLPDHIEDADALDFLAEILTSATRGAPARGASHKPTTTTSPTKRDRDEP